MPTPINAGTYPAAYQADLVSEGRAYPLPHGLAPNAQADVRRVAQALLAIDVDIAALLVSVALKADAAAVYTQAEVDAAIQAAIDALVGGAPGALDTLVELATALNYDAGAVATINTALAARYLKTEVDALLADRYTIAQVDAALALKLDAAAAQASLSVDDLIALTGVAEGEQNLGAFTGSTIPDDQGVKQALQALETGLESAGGTFPPTGAAADTQQFDASGAWTKPAGAKFVRVRGWGGGGCGQTGHSSGANQGGDGGQGGGYVEVWLHPDDLGATETVTVGAGQASTTTVGKGGDSTFGSHVTAFGGAGGGVASSVTFPTPNAEAGAPGGRGSEWAGRAGSVGGSALNAGAGGGGGAYDGTNATSSGGASVNGGAGGDGADENTAATDGAQPGGGGGGGVRFDVSAHAQEYVGGDGGDGRIIVETWT